MPIIVSHASPAPNHTDSLILTLAYLTGPLPMELSNLSKLGTVFAIIMVPLKYILVLTICLFSYTAS